MFYRFNKWHIGRLARAERVAVYLGAVIDAVADAGTESECFFLGGEDFGVREVDSVFLGEIGFEAVEVIVGDKVDCRLVGDDVNFDIHTFGVWEVRRIIFDFFAQGEQCSAEREQFCLVETHRLAVNDIVVEPLNEPRPRAIEKSLGNVGTVDASKHFSTGQSANI